MLAVDPKIEIVGDARFPTEELLRSTRPDVVLIDIDGSDVVVEEVAALIHSIDPTVRMCALSERLTRPAVDRCRAAGVRGFVVKDITLHEFRRAIGVVAAGNVYVDPRLAARESQPSRNDQRSHLLDLSIREGEVVRYIVAGLANKEIASRLSLSEKTVKNHVSRIFSKFDCTARTQVAVQAIRSGLV
jgi:DNA-binding NarL/FixJ family response regulator